MKKSAICRQVLCKVLGVVLALTILCNAGQLPLTLTATAASEGETSQLTVSAVRAHIVQTGDTLWALARRYKTTVAELMLTNGLHTSIIYVGQRLVVPSAPFPPRLAGLDCAWEGVLRSQDGAVASSVHFFNTTGQPVHLYWLNYQGERVFYATVASGSSFYQQSYRTHPWLVTDDYDQCLTIFVAQRQSNRAVIGGNQWSVPAPG